MSNPFAALSAFIPAGAMQAYVILMILAVIAGTVLDMMHKKSAKYFFANSKRAQEEARRPVGGGKKAGLAVKTVANEVLNHVRFHSVRAVLCSSDFQIHRSRCRVDHSVATAVASWCFDAVCRRLLVLVCDPRRSGV